jgi:sugar transferase (PEP-CTERM/EpsH1 system associated)
VALFTGEALSVRYYRDDGLRGWVFDVLGRAGIHKAVAFSGPMAQYLEALPLERRIIDFCDVDSAKWTQYAGERSWPLSWLYRREGRLLASFEQHAARFADASTFVTEAEADIFRSGAKGISDRILAMQNGVDAVYFTNAREYPDPYPAGGPVIVFTGAMDYWPNVDAVVWFAREVFPHIRGSCAGLRFCIVGMNPAAEVKALAGPGVIVTGAVDDVRPWLAHADLVVAPLRVARGIQNKVLEAMAMGKAVVVSAASAVGLRGTVGRDFLTATDAEDFTETVSALLIDPARRHAMQLAARDCAVAAYSWEAHLSTFEGLLRAEAGEEAAGLERRSVERGLA